ncbi:NAD(P)H-binding protein [Pseudomonas aeruginosa]|uniref:NAD(P)H-binding protein n=1 Tax=Pseudomonas aeruginosa TaxID=287 RepID=A0AAQ3QYK4_PSEAI|nr:NAD(P)H-binding protein [Pseudomonas aeruginosa]AVJ96416.1 NADH(P)-binding family protein [Pseudomonas aeruginosa]AVK11355.1 NADH(P)-binding family protein [Pseudomonas aeruginosa]EFQ39640.1 hypothetical protein PA39016_001380042 [Pseudomonas aeruginosa 39016]MCA4066445.1 NAD(P)H-binding protein [Pseudomonas aeruginosa]MCC0548890.1 NAD(P)H-binding protein [Pseudomonas aeruginosa]
MSKKILVLGATGTVGKPLVEGLLAKGEAVKAASRANRKMDGVESTPFDFGKPETIATALEGVDRTYMLLPAGYLNVRDLLLPFVEAAASRKVKIVFQSAFGVDANDANPMRQMGNPAGEIRHAPCDLAAELVLRQFPSLLESRPRPGADRLASR